MAEVQYLLVLALINVLISLSQLHQPLLSFSSKFLSVLPTSCFFLLLLLFFFYSYVHTMFGSFSQTGSCLWFCIMRVLLYFLADNNYFRALSCHVLAMGKQFEAVSGHLTIHTNQHFLLLCLGSFLGFTQKIGVEIILALIAILIWVFLSHICAIS
jgi:hypothetical protein